LNTINQPSNQPPKDARTRFIVFCSCEIQKSTNHMLYCAEESVCDPLGDFEPGNARYKSAASSQQRSFSFHQHQQ